jgi:hypothetical protein
VITSLLPQVEQQHALHSAGMQMQLLLLQVVLVMIHCLVALVLTTSLQAMGTTS